MTLHRSNHMRNSIVVCGFALTLAACRSSDRTAGSGEAGGTLVVVQSTDAMDVIPTYVQEETGRAVVDLVFDYLADMPANNSTLGDKGWIPALAKSWTWSPDSLSIAFTPSSLMRPTAPMAGGTPLMTGRSQNVRSILIPVFQDDGSTSSSQPAGVRRSG